LKGTELQKIYASADVFVFRQAVKLIAMSFGSMAAGYPGAPYAGGVKENLVHSLNGLLFSGKCLEMANEIGRLLLDNALRNNLAVKPEICKGKTGTVYFSNYVSCMLCMKKRQLLRKNLQLNTLGFSR
jgi:hypothetical protein